MRFKPGYPRMGMDIPQRYVQNFGEGLVATNGVVYGAISTFGTTAVPILNELIDPGYSMRLKRLHVGLTQQFKGENGSFVGSILYYWEACSEYIEEAAGVATLRTSPWINISGTYSKGVGTLVTSEDTFSGLIPVGSVTHAPVRLRLTAVGIIDLSCSGKIKNSSFVELVGNVIPGA